MFFIPYHRSKFAIWQTCNFFFEKTRFAFQKLDFPMFVSGFLFFSKIITKNDLTWLRNNKILQKLFFSIFVSLSSQFLRFLFLKSFLGKLAVVLQYGNALQVTCADTFTGPLPLTPKVLTCELKKKSY